MSVKKQTFGGCGFDRSSPLRQSFSPQNENSQYKGLLRSSALTTTSIRAGHPKTSPIQAQHNPRKEGDGIAQNNLGSLFQNGEGVHKIPRILFIGTGRPQISGECSRILVLEYPKIMLKRFACMSSLQSKDGPKLC